MRKTLKASLGVAALAVIGATLFASPANASPSGGPGTLPAKTAAPGATITVGANIWNGYGTGTTASGSPTVKLTAPSHSHFVSGNVYRVTTLGQEQPEFTTYWTCPLSADKKTIDCGTLGMGIDPGAPGVWRFLNFAAYVQVDADAPYGQTIDDGSFVIGSNGDIVGGTTPLQYKVAAKPAAPQVTNIDQTSGSTKIEGTGQAGATVTIKDASGKIVRTVTVDPDGTYTADIGSTTGDLTVTQTAGGVTSDATTISVVDTPVANPAVAGGLGVGAAALLGAMFLIRRKRANA